jgi:hypothetical protein
MKKAKLYLKVEVLKAKKTFLAKSGHLLAAIVKGKTYIGDPERIHHYYNRWIENDLGKRVLVSNNLKREYFIEIDLSENEVSLMIHALGNEDPINWYRNHFVASTNHHNIISLKKLESIDFMKTVPGPDFSSLNTLVYTVTDKGKRYLSLLFKIQKLEEKRRAKIRRQVEKRLCKTSSTSPGLNPGD